MEKDLNRGKFPRGTFYKKPEWTKDHSIDYYPDWISVAFWPIFKIGILLIIGYSLRFNDIPWLYTNIACVVVILLY